MKKKSPPFIMLLHSVYDSPAFEALQSIDIAVLLLLIRKHDGFNNGNISLGVREAATRCHSGKDAARGAFGRLQNSGLVSRTYKGHLVPEIGRPDVASKWRLNFVEEPARLERRGVVIKLSELK